MKNPILLVCAMMAAMGMTAFAEEAAAAKPDRPKHAEMTPEQREAMTTKRLEQIKEKNPELYKELIALKEKDPAAFKAKMDEMRKAHGPGKGHGKGKGGAAPVAPAAAAK